MGAVCGDVPVRWCVRAVVGPQGKWRNIAVSGILLFTPPSGNSSVRRRSRTVCSPFPCAPLRTLEMAVEVKGDTLPFARRTLEVGADGGR